MRRINFVLMSAIALVAFSGCAKLSDTFTVKVPVEATLELDVPAGGGDLKASAGHVFYASQVYNAGTEPKILEYKDRIKSIAADGGKAKINLVYPATSITLTNTALQVRNADTGVLLIAWNFESKTYANTAELTMGTPSSGSLDSFSEALDNGANLMFELTGDSGSHQDGWQLEVALMMTVSAGIF